MCQTGIQCRRCRTGVVNGESWPGSPVPRLELAERERTWAARITGPLGALSGLACQSANYAYVRYPQLIAWALARLSGTAGQHLNARPPRPRDTASRRGR